MVLHKYGDKLYQGLQEAVYEHLKGVAIEVANAPDHNFLYILNEAWCEHDRSMLMIRDILMYMVKIFFRIFLNFFLNFFLKFSLKFSCENQNIQI